MEITLTQVILVIGGLVVGIAQWSIFGNLWFIRKWMTDMEGERARMHERANALQTLLNNVQLNYVLKTEWRDFRAEIIDKLDEIEKYLRTHARE